MEENNLSEQYGLTEEPVSADLDGFEPVARIVVIGVGGAGNNAVNRMIDDQISNVDFYVLNTDKQALATSKAPNRIVLGEEVTKGLGAGGDPEVGRQAAEASRDKIAKIVAGADMVFIAAGMGGGTGTGAAPVVAEIAKEAGALVVAIVTRPFALEGKSRNANSVRGLNSLKDVVDSILIVSNDKLLQTAGNATASQAFSEADRVLSTSVHTVTDIILLPGYINRDFADVRDTLKDSGIALIGYGSASGPDKAVKAAEAAINCPLLEASISGARRAICSLTVGRDVKLIEFQDCIDEINRQAGNDIDIKFGVTLNEMLGDEIVVSIIASDFSEEFDFTSIPQYTRPTHETAYAGVDEARDADIRKNEQSEAKTPGEEEDSIIDSILPDFLRG